MKLTSTEHSLSFFILPPSSFAQSRQTPLSPH
jgi:hypothetical protein